MQSRTICVMLTIFCLVIPVHQVFAGDQSQTIRTKIEALQLSPRSLKNYSSYVGHLKPITKVSISSEIAGVIEVLNVDQGSRVTEGEIMVQIDTKRQLLNNQLNKSNYELALKDYNREAKLLSKKLSTPAKVAELKNKMEVNRLRLQLSELDLVKSRIKTPIKGLVSNPTIEMGEYVRVGDKLLEVLDISKVLALINIPEREIQYIELGKDVGITIDALPGEVFPGKVTTRALEADMRSRSFEVEVEIDNTDQKLLPGMLVRARLLKIHLENQILIPRHAIQEEEKGSFVYLVKNSAIEKRHVAIGLSLDKEVQILDGLRVGDVLVETGQQLVSPNEKVEVISLSKQK